MNVVNELTQPNQAQIDEISRLEDAGWRLERGPFTNYVVKPSILVVMSFATATPGFVIFHEYNISEHGRAGVVAGWQEQDGVRVGR